MSIASVMERKPTPRFSRAVTVSIRCGSDSAKAIQLPNNQHIALSHIGEGR